MGVDAFLLVHVSEIVQRFFTNFPLGKQRDRSIVRVDSTYDFIASTFAEYLLDFIADVQEIRTGDGPYLSHELSANVRVTRQAQTNHDI